MGGFGLSKRYYSYRVQIRGCKAVAGLSKYCGAAENMSGKEKPDNKTGQNIYFFAGFRNIALPTLAHSGCGAAW